MSDQESPPASAGLIWLGVCIVAQTTANAFTKMAGLASSPDNLSSLVTTHWYWAAISALVVQALCWIRALQSCELSLAYPMTSLVFGANLACAAWFFGEEVRLCHLIGIACIMTGVAMVGRTSV